MHRRYTSRCNRSSARTGFTLVEMLVATGLVVLIMLMFAQIFGTAVGTMTEQRAMAQNDQKARIVSSILRDDLRNMTYRQPAYPYGDVRGIVALAAGDEPIIDPVNQRGYFYYSENTATDNTDDIIQFTTQIRIGQRGDATTKNNTRKYVGKATNLSVGNEPEQDDGLDGDGVGTSSAAEICYFLRHGTLYRRVLLLRDPLQRTVRVDSQPSNPTTGVRKYSPSGTTDYSASDVYYHDFDYAAARVNGFLWFHSLESLDNTKGAANFPIAFGSMRFGFDASSLLDINSVEFDTVGMPDFVGRPTIGETSDDAFGWPGVGTDPYSTLTYDPDTGVIEEYDDGDRAGEDILLTNVEEFNVQIIDDNLGSFSNVTAGFDSWHPSVSGTAPHQDYKTSGLMEWTAGGTDINVPALRRSGGSYSSSMYYEQITSGTSGSRQPEFPPIPGAIVQDGSTTWRCVDNRIGIEGIRITIRYRDVASSLPRQVTIVHSFVE